MEVKWISIMCAVVFGSMFVGMGFDHHNKTQCRIEAIKAGVDADKVNVACGIK